MKGILYKASMRYNASKNGMYYHNIGLKKLRVKGYLTIIEKYYNLNNKSLHYNDKMCRALIFRFNYIYEKVSDYDNIDVFEPDHFWFYRDNHYISKLRNYIRGWFYV